MNNELYILHLERELLRYMEENRRLLNPIVVERSCHDCLHVTVYEWNPPCVNCVWLNQTTDNWEKKE